MRFLLFPGQGRPDERLLWRQHSLKARLVEWIEQRLCRALTADDFRDNVAYSALLVADSIATCLRYVEAGGQYAGVAGYSTGQFSALVAAGCLEPEETLELVMRRAQLMLDCTGSGFGMLSVLGLDEDALRTAIGTLPGRDLHVSTKNGSFSFSVSGSMPDLQILKDVLESATVVKKTAFLPVAGAWHSPFLAGAATKFEELVRSLPFRPLKKRYWDNVTGDEVVDVTQIRENLVRHLTWPVEWESTIRGMRRNNPSAWIECGAGTQLRQMLFFIDRTVPSYGMQSEEEITKCAALQD